MLSIPVKVFTGKKNAQGVHEHMIDYEIVDISVSKSTTFDELLQKCAVHCGIQPMFISLFAIWGVTTETWRNLKSCIYPFNEGSRSKDGSIFEFRIRFLMKTEVTTNGQKGEAQRWDVYKEGFSRIMDKGVVKYLYRQKRHDFLRDIISVTSGSEDDLFSVALGVAALDLLCLSQITNVKLTSLQKTVHVKHLLSTSFRRRFRDYGMINRYEIRRKFQHFVRYLTPVAERWHQNGNDLDFFLRRYLLNLELCTESYGVEKYNLSMAGYITVSADNGVTLHSGKSNGEKWCDISEITDMTLQIRSSDVSGSNTMTNHPTPSDEGCGPLGVVSVSKLNGACKKFVMESSSSAENLASCIDGYYRLLVDGHHYLCKDVCSGALVRNLNMKCHGPITCRYAEEILMERHSEGLATIGDCLIRMSKDSWDEYFVNTVHSIDPFKTRNYKMDRSPDNLLGLYGLEESHCHETLESLLTECTDGRYNNRRIPIHPDKIVAPKPKHKNNLIIRLCREALYTVYPKDENLIKPKAALIDFDPNEKQNVKHLGTGSFTIVKRYRNEDTGRCMVFKSILEQKEAQQNHHIHLSFQESTALLNCINHRHFIQHIGMTMSHVTGIWLEYLPHKSITQCLQSRTVNLTNSSSWFLHVLWQIAHAFHYLEEVGYAHGKLQGKNVLLQVDSPQPHIKISDSGVRTKRVSTEHDIEAKKSFVEPMLRAPWLAYEFCVLERKASIKYPTIEADKWSFGTTVCEILNWGRISQTPCYGRELVEPIRGCYLRGDLQGCLGLPPQIAANKELCDLITSCWYTIPDKRPAFQKILREIGSSLTTDYVMLPITPDEQIPDAIVKIDPDVPTYEDHKLTRISKLGEGHFGTVELFAYDRRMNNITEQVAIKEPSTPSMKRHKEFMKEIDAMKGINHPYIVRLLGITEPSGRIVMEYLRNGSLANLMRSCRNENKVMRIPQMLQYCSQIAEGMIALQERRIVHRDLALRNILLSNTEPITIKISDFGLSRFVKKGCDYYSGKIEEFPAPWYAPECLQVDSVRTFGFESDVWSYGVTIWEIFSYGERPYYKNLPIIRPELLEKFRQLLRDGMRLPQTANCPNEVYSIMTRCWAYDKHKRLKFQEIKVEFDNLVVNSGNLTYRESI